MPRYFPQILFLLIYSNNLRAPRKVASGKASPSLSLPLILRGSLIGEASFLR